MNLELFLGLVFLLLWLIAEAICVWLIFNDRRPPICYGYGVGDRGSSREGTAEAPNFYRKH
jgi:hypothetical protein